MNFFKWIFIILKTFNKHLKLWYISQTLRSCRDEIESNDEDKSLLNIFKSAYNKSSYDSNVEWNKLNSMLYEYKNVALFMCGIFSFVYNFHDFFSSIPVTSGIYNIIVTSMASKWIDENMDLDDEECIYIYQAN